MDKSHIHNLLNGVINLQNSGKYGNSIENPIKINLTQENDYIGTEYEIIKWLGFMHGFKWEVIGQTLHFRDSKKIDQLVIEIIQNNTGQKIIREYFFDITLCFNKLKSDVSDYLREKRNNLSK